MKLCDKNPGRPLLSFEIFPPKRTSHVDTIYQTLEALQDLKPDFISVTYGAGGSANHRKTMEIASSVQNRYHVESVAHLPSLYLSRAEVLQTLDQLRQNGIQNILALRGDRVDNLPPQGDFPHASDLIAFIRAHGDFHILGACYPETHLESAGVIDDIMNLRRKVDAGADRLITQMFLDNAAFYTFRERAALAGIHVPIEAGIMPVVNKRQIERMVQLCGVKLPEKFTLMMQRYENHPTALRDAGIAYAIDQIVDLLAHGVDGIHLYTMNNAYLARKIYEAVYSLFCAETAC